MVLRKGVHGVQENVEQFGGKATIYKRKCSENWEIPMFVHFHFNKTYQGVWWWSFPSCCSRISVPEECLWFEAHRWENQFYNSVISVDGKFVLAYVECWRLTALSFIFKQSSRAVIHQPRFLVDDIQPMHYHSSLGLTPTSSSYGEWNACKFLSLSSSQCLS